MESLAESRQTTPKARKTCGWVECPAANQRRACDHQGSPSRADYSGHVLTVIIAGCQSIAIGGRPAKLELGLIKSRASNREVAFVSGGSHLDCSLNLSHVSNAR